jgi:Fe-S cluster biogenesis protein NfuA
MLMNPLDDLKSRVTNFLTEEVAPFLQMEVGQIELIDIQDRIARIRLHGGCDSCPTSVMAVIMGVEEELRRRFPEIEYLQLVP